MNKNIQTVRVADMLVTCLKSADVKRIYGLIGDSLNIIGNAVAIDGTIDWVGVRHEETAAFAAGAEAYLTGKLGVCAGTCGPGSVHLVNGLYEANRNNTPVLAIATQFDSAQIGLDYFQATHPEKLFQDCSVFCETLSSESQMPRLVQTAIQTALSKRGVAVIIIPADIAQKEIPSSSHYLHAPTYSSGILYPNPYEISQAVYLINKYNNITLYVGHGCKNAMTYVSEFAEKIKAPLIHTIRSKEFSLSPFDTDLRGYLSGGLAEEAIKNTDLLILLGTDFPYDGLFPDVPIIQIDKEGSHIGRRSRLDLGIVSDVKTALIELTKQVNEKTDDTHVRQSIRYKEMMREKQLNDLEKMASEKTLRPEYLTAILNQIAEEDAIFIVDVGLNDMWANRYLEATNKRLIIGSFKHGTMAAAMPDAIGAAFACPDRQIIVLAGDGGLSMLMGDLLTIASNQLPIKIVVYNNQSLGFINFESQIEKIPPFKTELTNPDFSQIAESMGIKGYSVDTPKNLMHILNNALQEDGPVLINAWTDPHAIGNE